MANLTFNFNNIQRSFLNVTLKDGTVLQVKMPKKSTFSKLQKLQDLEKDESTQINDVMDTFAGVMAEILNNNLNKVTVGENDIEDQYDIEEMKEFIKEYYSTFVGGLAKDPN